VLKLLLIGAWGAATVVGGAMLSHSLVPSTESLEGHGAESGLEQVATELTGVPVILDGKVSGYLVFKIRTTLDRSKFTTPGIDAIPYLMDAGFRSCYALTEDGISKFGTAEMDSVAAGIKQRADIIFGEGSVVAVNLEQFNFVRSEEIRGNLFKIN
jgi:hypothetical protein